jgi:hypothetical protein
MSQWGERLLIELARDEATALDAFLSKNGLPSRAAAIHEILKLALGVAPKNVTRDALLDPAARVTKPMTKPWERAKVRCTLLKTD